MCVLALANFCPREIRSPCVFGVRSLLMHRATVLLWVSTVVAFHAALIGGGAVGAAARITAPAGVHWLASPEGMPRWGPIPSGWDVAWFLGV